MPFIQVLDRETNTQRRLPIAKAIFAIGKSPASDLVLDKNAISRQHCEIVNTNGAYVIRDLGSRNGTYVEGRRITAPAPLAEGSRVDLGPVHVVFSLGDAAVASSAPAATAAGATKAGSQATGAAREAGALTRRLIPPELKKKIHERLLVDLDLRHIDISQQTDEELRTKTEAVVRNVVATMSAEVPLWVAQDQLIKEVVDEAIGLGPIEDLLADRTIDEIMVNNWDRIYIERKGKIELTEKCFTDNAQVIHIIRRIIAPLGRRIDESSPMVDARLKDGSRVNAIITPLAISGPTLTIRKFAADPYTERDLVKFGSITEQVVEFMKTLVQYRANIIISGGTGSGKTVLLNVVSSFIPHDERIVTIEDAAELKLKQEHVVSLEAKPANIEGKGAIPIRELVRNSLRMRPDRIIVGECRGGEALDMLQAMNTGHDGSLTTIHANSERDALARVETMVLMAGMDLPSRAIREQVASAVDFIAQLSRMTDGTRKLTGLSEVTGMEGDIITMQPIYQFEQRGFGEGGKVLGSIKPTGAVPKFIHELRARGIPVDMTLFQDLTAPPPQPGPRPHAHR